jgi:hypothetical protein
MRASMGLIAALSLGWSGCLAPAGCRCPVPMAADAGPDGGPLACDRPALLDPMAVVDLATFRAQASAGACDFSLRCGWGVMGDAFCDPAFAASVGTSAPLDLDAARTCVAQLAASVDCDAALAVALDCRLLNDGATQFVLGGQACCPPNLPAPSMQCSICSFGLTCQSGVCAPTAGLGAVCSATTPCEPGSSCTMGRCVAPPVAQLGEDCTSVPCARGLQCDHCVGGTPASFCVAGAGVPPVRHHFGCGCMSAADCPSGIGACLHGACVRRPNVGEACSTDGPTCVAAPCDATSGTCPPVALGGSCGSDRDCASGLVCAFVSSARAFTCVHALHLGDACDAAVDGECRGSCCDGSTCVSVAGRGGSCSVCACASGTTCDATSLVCR